MLFYISTYFGWLLLVSFTIYAGGTVLMLYGLLRRTRPQTSAAPFVSVVVAARNEEHRLPALLEDLTAQTYPHFEVVIVDDRSLDRTAELVLSAAARAALGKFKLVRQTSVPDGSSPKKMALQKGVESSRGEIILLTDADCRVRPTWVERMAAHYDDSDVAMVLGYSELIVDERSTLFEKIQAFEFLTLVTMMAGSAKAGRPFGATGQNISYRRAAFDRLGGYASMMHRIAGDDMLMLQLFKANRDMGRVVYADDPGAHNATYPEKNWASFRQQRARWASSGTHHFRRDPLFATYAVNSLVLNMTVLCGGLWALAGWLTLANWLFISGAKLGVDAIFYFAAAVKFRRRKLMRYFPWWFLSQPLYLLAMAYWGQRRRQVWVWKP